MPLKLFTPNPASNESDKKDWLDLPISSTAVISWPKSCCLHPSHFYHLSCAGRPFLAPFGCAGGSSSEALWLSFLRLLMDVSNQLRKLWAWDAKGNIFSCYWSGSTQTSPSSSLLHQSFRLPNGVKL